MSEQGPDNGLPDAEWSRPVLLQQAREQAGLHIAALAAALKVPVRKLEALEAGRYDELPDLTFARALASSACRHLRLDPAPVLAQIPQGRRPALGGAGEALNTPFRPAQQPSGPSGTTSPARRVWWGAAVLLLAAVGLYVWPDASEWLSSTTLNIPASAPTPVSTTAEPVVTLAQEGTDPAPVPAVEPALPLLQDTAGAPSAASPVQTLGPDGRVATEAEAAATVQGAAVVEAPALATTATLAPSSSVADVADERKLLVIRASDETWIEVVNGSGKVVIQRVFKAGDSMDFSSAPPYRVVVGRADVVQVLVRGQSFDVMPHARNSVARFEVR
ncbi:MAG: DUF4115 domain-containing protein [Burkholderiaceae bacterium]